MQFSLPGMPCVYYGDEEGMQGFRDPFCREPYAKAPAKNSLRALYSKLAHTRNSSKVLQKGDAAFAAFGGDIIAVLRCAGKKAVLTIVNRSDETVTLSPNKTDFLGLTKTELAKLPDFGEIIIPPMDFALTAL